MRDNIKKYQSGAVSIFIVMFAAILLTGVTVGFTIIMLSDQNRSTDNDLSQSAKDSAEAGIEDAKRVLAQLADCRNSGLLGRTDTAEAVRCNDIQSAINRKECDTISRSLGVVGEKERPVFQSVGDDKLIQAYTCVTINTDTDSFIGKTTDEGDMKVIPLEGSDKFDAVEVSWLDRSDVSSKVNFTFPAGSTPDTNNIVLPKKSEWGDRGAVIRVGVMPYNPTNVVPDTIDDRSRVAFMYSGNSGVVKDSIDLYGVDAHKPIYHNSDNLNSGVPVNAVNYVTPVKCENVKNSDALDYPTVDRGYLCKTLVKVKEDINNTDEVFFTFASMYRPTSFKLTLKDWSDPSRKIQFSGTQPEVDSTGRANNVFRRVVARVEATGGDSAPYPRAAVSSNGGICKNFAVTDSPDFYTEGSQNRQYGSCYDLKTGQLMDRL